MFTHELNKEVKSASFCREVVADEKQWWRHRCNEESLETDLSIGSIEFVVALVAGNRRKGGGIDLSRQLGLERTVI
ncbi:hypothetical protein L195_g018235 [Trifolium pratense]|uniref:Uncharacterized protein n=1 Tax=Trifolium pratense TaxID=57577 RepID=A0A2K3MW62_TRIPR|nr:hypothetical protein L195_g018235 [Trifolium pratense]